MVYPALSTSQIRIIELSRTTVHNLEQFKALETIGRNVGLIGCAVRFVSEIERTEHYGLIHRASNSLFSDFPHLPTKISLRPFDPIEFQDRISVFSGDYYCDFKQVQRVGMLPINDEALYFLNSASIYVQSSDITEKQPIEVYDVDSIGKRQKIEFCASQTDLKSILDIRLSDLTGKIENRYLWRLIRYKNLSGDVKYKFIGDLVQSTEKDICNVRWLRNGAINAVNTYLGNISDGKLKLGLRITGWSRPS